jgi:hypothetical protein
VPSHRLAAKLLRQGDALRFCLSVRVVRSDADPKAVGHRNDDGFDFTRAVGTEHHQPTVLRERLRGDTVVERRR